MHANTERWLTLGPDPETLDLQDWPIPQLYQVGDDPVLQPQSAGPAATGSPTTPTDGLHGFPPAPRYRFQGRAWELLGLERAFTKHPAVLLHAMGGMGKTALAREAAHWWRRTGRFRTAVFHSFEQQAGAERVVQVLGQALAGENFSSLGSEEQWPAAVRLFRSEPVLLVWDNFKSTLPAFQRDLPGDRGSGFQARSGTEAGRGKNPLPRAFDHQACADLQRLYSELTADPMPKGRLLVTC